MPVTRVVIVPAAPLLVPEASAAQPDQLRDAVGELRRTVTTALASLPEQGTALLLDSGAESLVHDAAMASLAGYGLRQVTASISIDPHLITAVSARGQAPRVRSDRLDGDPAVLALLLAQSRPGLQLAPITIPAGASAAGLHDIAVGLTAAADSLPGPVYVIATGDLAATLDTTSPGYEIAGARDWDAGVVEAVRQHDPVALGEFGPAAAVRFQARGWAPITVALLLAEAHRCALSQITYLAPRGVGQLIAH